ncbi:hypothetical protein NMY22_g11746 [Coprinellus aureogranulatus]|nr:hypothetical protein NMY22_g11746 [Coprinellus aureogranulatus]
MLPDNAQTPWVAYQQAQGFYPTPPVSSDGLDNSAYPVLLGLAQSPAPLVSMLVPYAPLKLMDTISSPSVPTLQTLFGHGSFMTHTIDAGEGVEEQMLTVSTSFHPGSFTLESDLILCSTDAIHFYVHTDYLNKASQAALPAFLRYAIPGVEGAIIPIPEAGRILNIILHAIYGTIVSKHSPTTAELLEALDKLPNYGLIPRDLVRPNTDLYNLLLTHAALTPLVIYATAAFHDIFELAQQASSHLLAYPLNEVDDILAMRMGPAYLKRLFLLHMNRIDAAKRVLLQPPGIHAATKKCTFEDQKKVKRAWALGSTYLAWEIRADLSSQSIKGVFEPLAAELDCAECRQMINKRVHDVLVSWAAVKIPSLTAYTILTHGIMIQLPTRTFYDTGLAYTNHYYPCDNVYQSFSMTLADRPRPQHMRGAATDECNRSRRSSRHAAAAPFSFHQHSHLLGRVPELALGVYDQSNWLNLA